jgi:outer membrane lipoprotein SlyB
MDTRDKIAMLATMAAGGAAGQYFAGVAGLIVGALAGLGVLVLVYAAADAVDVRLAEHYGNK